LDEPKSQLGEIDRHSAAGGDAEVTFLQSVHRRLSGVCPRGAACQQQAGPSVFLRIRDEALHGEIPE
jgi:hypothetical protein